MPNEYLTNLPKRRHYKKSRCRQSFVKITILNDNEQYGIFWVNIVNRLTATSARSIVLCEGQDNKLRFVIFLKARLLTYGCYNTEEYLLCLM